MKATIFSVLFMATMMFACNQKKENENETDADTTVATETSMDTMATDTSVESGEKFACSMHPEIIGNKGEKCSKCNMDLTVPVAQ